MPIYYVNKNAQPTGEHEVHTSDCSYLPDTENRKYLRQYFRCQEAIVEARKYYDDVDGCFYCSIDCHNR